MPETKTDDVAAAESREDEVDDYDVTCFVVNDEEIITEEAKSHVVCTSEPDEVSFLCMIESVFANLYHGGCRIIISYYSRIEHSPCLSILPLPNQ